MQSSRLDGIECAIWLQRCPSCATTLWQEPGSSDWVCPKCDAGRKVSCPKTRLLTIVPNPTQHWLT